MREHRDGHRAKARPGPRRRGPAMTVDEARKAALSFYRAYFLHPLTWAPAAGAVGLMAIVGPASERQSRRHAPRAEPQESALMPPDT